ncbi:hypothetical protein ACJH6J_29915, partial [Mycobacterium sp. SMC-18]
MLSLDHPGGALPALHGDQTQVSVRMGGIRYTVDRGASWIGVGTTDRRQRVTPRRTDDTPLCNTPSKSINEKEVQCRCKHSHLVWRNCQYLWIGLFQATSVPVDSVGAES